MDSKTQTAAVPDKRRCKRPSGKSAAATLHRLKMATKKARRMLIEPGFVPVRTGRVENAIEVLTATLLIENADAVQRGLALPLSPLAAHQEATRQVARNLPQPRQVADWRQRRGSKSDQQAYRARGIWPVGKLAAPGRMA